MTHGIFVIKRSGEKQLINLNKINQILNWSKSGLNNISVAKIESSSHIQLYNNITTAQINDIIIKTAANLISTEAPDYQYVAARLSVFQLRKKAYKNFTPPPLYKHVHKLVTLKKYDSMLLKKYTPKEFFIMNSFIHHERDMSFSYAAVKQLEGKYLIQNRITGTIYESAQFLYILIAACLFAKYPQETRLSYIHRFYDAISTFKISLPTPIMAGVRTPTRQFSSCVLIDCADNLNSINATTSSIVKYISQRAGIGINAGQIRAAGSSIRDGEAFHTGSIPFYKHFQTAVKCCSQGGIRGGAATIFYPIWHFEVENLLVLKNNRGIEDNRVRHMDYAVQINKLMYQRMLSGEHITLFDPSDTPKLYNAFFTDQKEFNKLYIEHEKQENIKKKSIKALDLFVLLMHERTSTGRIYIQNIDHCNSHGSFNPKLAPIKQSNLCLEITLPTKPLDNIYDENGEIALCTLSAFNLGAIKNLSDLEDLADLSVRALDEILEYQQYPILAAKKSALSRRSLGIGVINFAYYLAKHNVRYSDGSANNLTHKTFEAIQYYLIKASCALAKERGVCTLFHQTNYFLGKLPIDTYKKYIDDICDEPLHLDWQSLREDVKKYGLRNSALSAIMPSETSSQISNSTNGIEPPRGFVSVKVSKDGMLRQVVPSYNELKQQYELLWDMPNNEGYLQIAGIIQKFTDQSISVNTNYNPERFENEKIPMRQLLYDILIAYKLGLKTLYYQNIHDGSKDNHTFIFSTSANDHCESGSCAI
ncbi:class 1a ribonucleoside-diphosphate reductase subunit alpha [Buchnera aphidicola]|uniref:class 1a ribonucleoside-diphosphate reductase subunit alpha n=1 Tax=Buchnera aphidicola TaxID=9 RepID=UPI0034649BC5